MDWKLLTEQDFTVSRWSGGTTKELAIAPEGAVYGDRDFLWRLSSATVELEHSDFTPLPDYDRLISTLSGPLDMKIGDAARFTLHPLEVQAFDGGVPVESWGRCTDFNLMLRKGRCAGTLTALRGPFMGPWPGLEGGARRDLAVYCVSGEVRLPTFGLTAQAGQMLLCRDAGPAPVVLEVPRGELLLAGIRDLT